jgi:hypothetical protein
MNYVVRENMLTNSKPFYNTPNTSSLPQSGLTLRAFCIRTRWWQEIYTFGRASISRHQRLAYRLFPTANAMCGRLTVFDVHTRNPIVF